MQSPWIVVSQPESDEHHMCKLPGERPYRNVKMPVGTLIRCRTCQHEWRLMRRRVGRERWVDVTEGLGFLP